MTRPLCLNPKGLATVSRAISAQWHTLCRSKTRDVTKFQFRDDSGELIDSHLDVLPRELILHSREGTIGSPNARNTQYGLALKLLLERIHRPGLGLEGVWVDGTIA